MFVVPLLQLFIVYIYKAVDKCMSFIAGPPLRIVYISYLLLLMTRMLRDCGLSRVTSFIF